MRALVLHHAGEARVEDRPTPRDPGPDEVRLRVTRAGLCGTDATEYVAGPVLTPLDTRHRGSGVLGPVVLGHEFVGVVEDVGSGVDLASGLRVAAGAGVWCGTCQWCAAGRTNLCASYWTAGLSADGGLAERVTVPARMLVPLPEGLGDDDAALAQPLSVALHAVDRAGVRPEDVVVVHGVGAIGSFVVAGAVAAGASRVVALDVDPARLQAARELGATDVVDVRTEDARALVAEITDGDLADVTVEASGLPTGLGAVQPLTRRGGSILLVGLPKKRVELDSVDLILREISLATTVAHVCDADLALAVALLARRPLAGLVVERVVPLERALEDALQPLARGEARGKLLVDCAGAT